MRHTITLLVVLLVLGAGLAPIEVQAPQRRGPDPAKAKAKAKAKGKAKQPSQNSACNDVPAHPVDVILGRPTRDSVTISVLAYLDLEGSIAYGSRTEALTKKTLARRFSRGEPAEVVVGSLRPDTQYDYELRAAGVDPVRGTFHTQRDEGKTFIFTVTSDSHLDDRVSAALYQRTLANALADEPDFHVDLGDTFMTEKHESRAGRRPAVPRPALLLRPALPLGSAVPGAWQPRRRKPTRPGQRGRSPGHLVKPDAQAIFPKPCTGQLLRGQRSEAPGSRPAPGLLRVAMERRLVHRA